MKTLSKIFIALICGGFAITGCGYFQPAPESANKNENAPSRCELLSMIDDMEDADSQILTREGRGGYLYTFVDESGSKISPPTNKFMVSRGGVGDSKYLMRMKGILSGAEEVYGGMGFGLALEGPEATYDASKYTGISFIAKTGPDSVGAVRFSIADANTDPAGGICKDCYNHFGITIKVTEDWTRYVIHFNELKQLAGWGDPQPEKLDASALISMLWQVNVPNAKFDVYVDDITFIGACGEEQQVTPAAPPAEEAPEAPQAEAPQAEAGENTPATPAADPAPAAN